MKTPRLPTGLYEKEDLIELLKRQVRQADNRITPIDLKLAADALSFSDKIVGEVMIVRRKVKWIAASDAIGPMVMDELHKTGHTRFPVVKEVTRAANPQVVGALYLNDLLEHLDEKGRIHDLMHPGVKYINETQSLPEALQAFLESGLYLLLVVNNFEEIAGVLTLEDVLQQVFGRQPSEPQTNSKEVEAKVE